MAAFDIDPQRVGATIEGVKVFHLDQLADVAPEQPHQARHDRRARPGRAGRGRSPCRRRRRGIVNFAPVTINLPEHVRHIGVDLAIELEQLSFAVVNRTATDGK